MASYSISYYKAGDFKYVDSRMYSTARDAIVRALLHINSHPDNISTARVIYQGFNTQKVVRRLSLEVTEPKHQ